MELNLCSQAGERGCVLRCERPRWTRPGMERFGKDGPVGSMGLAYLSPH